MNDGARYAGTRGGSQATACAASAARHARERGAPCPPALELGLNGAGEFDPNTVATEHINYELALNSTNH
ncbi:MAG TPA: hypothetical protein VMU86_05480 [Steroidobacteraceae bacterium]|nr:hypothetical protein [Steroidobacteraceae bacterium]